MNPTQCRLVRLKIAAWRTLSHSEMLAWLGITACGDRSALHARLEPLLSNEDRAWWRRRLPVIRKGVWYAGLWEETLSRMATGAALVRRRLINDLFACDSLAAQAELWNRRWDRGLWAVALHLLAQPLLWRLVGEPGGERLPPPSESTRIIRHRFARAASTFLLRDSDFAWLMLRGRHSTDALPLHLRPENFEIIRSRLDRIEVRLGSLDQLDPADAFDAFSLSDFSSYVSQSGYAGIWQSVSRAATPGARWCERVLLNILPLPPQLGLDEALSSRLASQDRAIVYDIRTGTFG